MKKILACLLGLSLLIFSIPAFAQFVANFKDASGTVSTASTQALGAATRQMILVQNVSASNNLGVTFDGTVAAIGSAGTIILTPGQGIIFQGNVPAGAINVIGSASSTTYTIKYL